MKFRNFAENLLGSKIKVKVLLYLLSEGVPTSEREIARILGISHMAVNKAMKEFYDLNLVMPMRIGNVNVWKINEQSYAYKVIKDLKLRSPLEDLKLKIYSSLNPYEGVKKVVIFGSVAEGKELPESDIDLLVVIEKEEQRKYILKLISKLTEQCINLYGNRLSSFIVTEKKLKRKKRIMESIRKGIVVIG